MPTKAVVVFDSSGPLINTEVGLAGQSGLTNSDGYIAFQTSQGDFHVRLLATNHKVVVQPVTLDNANQEIHFGGDPNSGPPNTLHYPPISFNQPSHDRDSIINVKANMCNLRDADDIPIFDVFIGGLILNNLPKAGDWITRLLAAGTTHINISPSASYNEDLGWAPLYPIPAFDMGWTGDGFKLVIDYVLDNGLIPIIKLGLDGQSGWQYGIDNLANILPLYSNYYNLALWSTGYDGCFPTWNRDQTIQMLQLLRNLLGDQACIDTEFSGGGSVGYCHMGQGAADWASDKLGLLDNFSVEVMVYPPQEDGLAQTATRILGPSALNTPKEPYYLAGLDKKINMCLYENGAYQAIRKQITPQQSNEAQNPAAKYGFTSFGNGQPTIGAL